MIFRKIRLFILFDFNPNLLWFLHSVLILRGTSLIYFALLYLFSLIHLSIPHIHFSFSLWFRFYGIIFSHWMNVDFEFRRFWSDFINLLLRNSSFQKYWESREIACTGIKEELCKHFHGNILSLRDFFSIFIWWAEWFFILEILLNFTPIVSHLLSTDINFCPWKNIVGWLFFQRASRFWWSTHRNITLLKIIVTWSSNNWGVFFHLNILFDNNSTFYDGICVFYRRLYFCWSLRWKYEFDLFTRR